MKLPKKFLSKRYDELPKGLQRRIDREVAETPQQPALPDPRKAGPAPGQPDFADWKKEQKP